MPRGIAADGLWRGQELIADWLARQQAPFCACGCRERIVLKKQHRSAGIPRFVLGHHARVRLGNYKGVDRWVEKNRGQHRCQCGCGSFVDVVARHHAVGIPRYLPNHSPPPSLGVGDEHPCFVADRTQVKRPRAFPAYVKRAVFEAFGGRCAWCGTTDSIECDHITPASLGGEAPLTNAQLLCANCHRWKSAIEPTSKAPKTRAARSRNPREEHPSCP